MALPVNIADLLHGKSVEWERMECKQGWNHEAVLRTLCAFANDFHNLGGGYIFIGVAEQNGQPVLPPVGIAPASIDAIQKEILHFGYHAIVPQYHPVVVPYVMSDKTILVIWAPGGQQRPYKAKASLAQDEHQYRYYIRQNSSTVVAQGDYEIELLSLAAQVPFDDRMDQRATVDDLDRERMLSFLKEVGSELLGEAPALSTLELAKQMHIVDGAAEALFPRNVGLLFFGRDPQKHFREARIEVAWFPDGPAGDSFSEKVFAGPVDRMLREALDFIQRNYLHHVVTKHPDRAPATRVVNYPYAAIEEALVNAVYHRSYEVREPIEVRITPEELTILSYPGPDRSINMDQLRAGRAVSRRYRNRRIGEFLKELDLTEGRATGIPKIMRAMRENGSPEPVFESEDERTTFLVRLPVHAESLLEPESQPESQPESLEFRILTLLSNGTRSKATLSKDLGQRSVSGPLNQLIRKLLDEGRIELTIPEKPASRMQQYRITPAGLALAQGRATGTRESITAAAQDPTAQVTDQVQALKDSVLEVHSAALGAPTDQVTAQVTDQVEALSASLLEELAATLDLPTAQVTEQVTAQVNSILDSMVAGERSRDELMQAAELSHREHFRKFYLNPLMVAGWVVRTLPDPNSRLQRYRITAKGEVWLQRLNTLPKP